MQARRMKESDQSPHDAETKGAPFSPREA